MNSVASPAQALASRTRLLVVIASYGSKNLDLLSQQIDRYRRMNLTVDVIVISNDSKQLGADVRVAVGLPTSNPWSLPFAHKAIFQQHLEEYDLFAYSEDDIGVSEANIRAFLDITPQLADDEIAGFLRYEVDQSGARFLPDVHGNHHWEPGSVERRGEHVVASFTNEHAAFYLLTRDQLRRAIASGGFMRAPYEAKYDMLCTAATDPYTSCGFRKVICVSSLDGFLIHHLSNRYARLLGVPLQVLQDQIAALLDVAAGALPASSLLTLNALPQHADWTKSYYEPASEALVDLVPKGARSVLSIGCGWGAMESTLRVSGMAVTALPLDSIIGAVAARAGAEVIHGTLDECFSALEGRTFDAVIVTNLLHLLPNAADMIERCSPFVSAGGSLVICGPNFASLRVRAKRALGRVGHRAFRAFAEPGIKEIGPRWMTRLLKRAGLAIVAVRWLPEHPTQRFEAKLGSLGAASWALHAVR